MRFHCGDVVVLQRDLDEAMPNAPPLCPHFGLSARQCDGAGTVEPSSLDFGELCGWRLLARVALTLVRQHCTCGSAVTAADFDVVRTLDQTLVSRLLMAQDHMLEPWCHVWRERLCLLWLRAHGDGWLHTPERCSTGKAMCDWGGYMRAAKHNGGLFELSIHERRTADQRVLVQCQTRGVDGQPVRGVAAVVLNMLDSADAPLRLQPGERVHAARVVFEPVDTDGVWWVRYAAI